MSANPVIYFFCQSFQAFNLAARLSMNGEIRVITSAENVRRASDHLGIKTLIHRKFSKKDLLKKDKLVPELQQIAEEIGEHPFHFSHTQFSLFCFALLGHLHRQKKKIVFHDFEAVYEKAGWELSSRYLRRKALIMLFGARLGVPLELRKTGQELLVDALKLRYIQQVAEVKKYSTSLYFEKTLEYFKEVRLPEFTTDHLFVAQALSIGNVFDKNRVEEVIEAINDLAFSVKMHPKLGRVEGLENCNEFPQYLPVEFFFNTVKKTVVSFSSASLVTASMFDHIKAISLLDIVGTDDPYTALEKKRLIERSKHRVLFPRDVDEFKQMLGA